MQPLETTTTPHSASELSQNASNFEYYNELPQDVRVEIHKLLPLKEQAKNRIVSRTFRKDITVASGNELKQISFEYKKESIKQKSVAKGLEIMQDPTLTESQRREQSMKQVNEYYKADNTSNTKVPKGLSGQGWAYGFFK